MRRRAPYITRVCHKNEWMSIFDSTCHFCCLTCEHATQRIHGVDRVQCSDGQFDVAAGHVYCLYEQDDTVLH